MSDDETKPPLPDGSSPMCKPQGLGDDLDVPPSTSSVDENELGGLTDALGLDLPASTGVDPLLGVNFGGVTLVRMIAEGGMGRVYEGLQDKPRRPVAVKVMRPGFVSREVCRRFANESEVLGRLRHPYIAQIYAAGICTIAGAQVPYFVMEYVAHAMPITAYAKQHSLTTQQRLDLFRKVCEAIAHGHERAIVHRDLKPSNILVEPEGFPKVIDFGIARCVDATPEQITALTDVGQLIGTVQYMSPEQFSADPTQIDVRSDVYALGVVLYELLAGRPPFEISHKQIFEAAQVVRNNRPVPLSELNSRINPEVEKAVDRCLKKSQADRYANAAELAYALGSCGDGTAARSVARGAWLRRFWDANSDRQARLWFPLIVIATSLMLGVLSRYAVAGSINLCKKIFDDFDTPLPSSYTWLVFVVEACFPIAVAFVPGVFVLWRRSLAPERETSMAFVELVLVSAALLFIGSCLLCVALLLPLLKLFAELS